MKKAIKASNHSEIRYIVHYGAPFNIQKKTFDNRAQALNFVRSHVFSDARFCYAEEVRPMEMPFEFVDDTAMKDPALRRKLFERGIATIDEFNASENGVMSSTKVTGSSKGNKFKIKSQCQFDFDLGDDYDSDYVENAIVDIFSDLGYDVDGVDFHSVDYPRGKQYSQASVDFIWKEDYDADAIEDALTNFIDDEGGNFLGIDFYELEF